MDIWRLEKKKNNLQVSSEMTTRTEWVAQILGLNVLFKSSHIQVFWGKTLLELHMKYFSKMVFGNLCKEIATLHS